MADQGASQLPTKDCLCYTVRVTLVQGNAIWVKNSPAVFQRMMQQLLAGLNSEEGVDFVSVYINNVLVFSPSLEKHLEHLEIKPSKCQFVQSEVHYLGHVITPQGLIISEEHLRVVKDFETPKDLHQLR